MDKERYWFCLIPKCPKCNEEHEVFLNFDENPDKIADNLFFECSNYAMGEYVYPLKEIPRLKWRIDFFQEGKHYQKITIK